ncbi:MAG: hypothetical protein R3D59_15155 [Paracoccaceae bacterium]
MLFAMRTTSYLCAPVSSANGDPEESIEAEIELHFATSYSVGRNRGYRSFPLVGAVRQFDIYVSPDQFSVGSDLDCSRNRGALDQTNNATPAFVDMATCRRSTVSSWPAPG